MGSVIAFGVVAWFPEIAGAAELTYEAPAECPSREGALARLGDKAPKKHDVKVTIAKKPSGGFAGEVSMGEEGIASHLEGETCEAVIDSLGLVISLGNGDAKAIAPSSPTEPGEPGEPPPPTPKSSPVSRDRPIAPEKEDDDGPDVRSRVEFAVGSHIGFRKLSAYNVDGATIFGEVAAPALAVDGYRPSLRAGLVAFSETGISFGEPAKMIGGMFDVCPLGAALISSRKIDLVLSGCGQLDVATAGRDAMRDLWIDAGPIGRLAIQIGRKAHLRGFVSADGGALWRVGKPLATSVNARTPQDAMWTFGLGGGLLFK